MSEFVIMPKSDYEAACNALRTRSGKTDLIKSGELEAEILGITGGGGSSADVCYVTFKSDDGTVEYGKKAVAVGDNCADPIARGVFGKPTKESTAQFDFTHDAWATEPNGATNPDALKAVTEDRVVYATFVSAVRYYTISYYDGEILRKSVSLAYGATPATYNLEKDGFSFDGWLPEVTTVTGDASYYAQWIEKIEFATAPWATIARISESGEAKKYFNLGDKKELAFTAPNGTSYTVNMVINGFNHDDLADDSGKAGISLTNEYTTYTARINDKDANNGVVVEWGNCELRTDLNNAVYNSFPAELKSAIKSVKKKHNYYDYSNKVFVTDSESDKVWIPSLGEIGCSTSGNYVNEGSTKYANIAKRKTDSEGTKQNYWLRNGVSGSGTYWVFFGSGNDMIRSVSIINSSPYVVFGFCI